MKFAHLLEDGHFKVQLANGFTLQPGLISGTKTLEARAEVDLDKEIFLTFL